MRQEEARIQRKERRKRYGLFQRKQTEALYGDIRQMDFENDNFIGFLLAIYFFPCFYYQGMDMRLACVLVFLIGFCLYVLLSKYVLFNEDGFYVQKYRWRFTRKRQYTYEDINYVFIGFITTSVRNPGIVIHLKNGKKERVSSTKSYGEAFLSFFKGKKCKDQNEL